MIDLKTYATINNIPIISDEGMLFIKNLIQEHQIKHVLEIGTAIGFSAIEMASFGVYVDTFERNQTMILQAKEAIHVYQFQNQIRLIEADALLYEGDLGQYDMIFIDGAKAQYQKFFEKYEKYLKDNGIIICDNLSFHHLDPQKVSKNTRQLLSKIERFKNFLLQNDTFETTFHHIGDGMSVSKRKKL
jgi:predicted O-methyltransferase YrrM